MYIAYACIRKIPRYESEHDGPLFRTRTTAILQPPEDQLLVVYRATIRILLTRRSKKNDVSQLVPCVHRLDSALGSSFWQDDHIVIRIVTADFCHLDFSGADASHDSLPFSDEDFHTVEDMQGANHVRVCAILDQGDSVVFPLDRSLDDTSSVSVKNVGTSLSSCDIEQPRWSIGASRMTVE